MPTHHSSKATPMNRRQFLKTAGIGAASAAALTGCPCLPCTSDHPNILLIMVDQMRWPRWFPEDASLPAFERLRAEGLTFTNFFTSAVPCSASRASIFTGLHQPQHGVATNVAMGPIPGDGSMNPRLPTLGHVFQDAGYRTPYFGKWHLTTMEEYEDKGLSAYGFEDWQGPDAWGLPFQGTRRDPDFVDQTIDWLEMYGKCAPWFATCSLIDPHGIMYYRRLDIPPIVIPNICDTLPDNFADTLEGKPEIQRQYRDVYGTIMGTPPDADERVWRQYIDYYYFLTKDVDDQITRLLDALDRMRLAEDTLVLFVSDHGEMAGAHRLQSKGPYIYDENNHVPAVIRWPGRVAAGQQANALLQTVDLFPTLVDIAGIDANTSYLPGKSFRPIVENPAAAGINDHILMAFAYSNASDFVQMAGVGRIPELTAPMMLRGIFDGHRKYARYYDVTVDYQEYELYNLNNDPLEMDNLAGDPGAEADETLMRDWLAEAEATEMAPIPEEVLRPETA